MCPSVSTMPVVNLLLVSTPSSNGGQQRSHYKIAYALNSTFSKKNSSYVGVNWCWIASQQNMKKPIYFNFCTIYQRCHWHEWCSLSGEYIRVFSNKIDIVLIGYNNQYHGGWWFTEKLKVKILVTLSFFTIHNSKCTVVMSCPPYNHR